MSSKEASTSSLDRRHAATRETVPQPRHVARLVFSSAARPSQRCDVTAFHVRSPPACDTRTSVRPGWIELPVPPRATFDSFHSFIPIPLLPLGHGFGGIPAPCSFGSSAFPFPPKNSSQTTLKTCDLNHRLAISEASVGRSSTYKSFHLINAPAVTNQLLEGSRPG